ncbi:MAG: hypothetical protein JW910_17595 [Anaerolineae bacterium]|nr:hypothetical protein [Anaerolineae bacterium]
MNEQLNRLPSIGQMFKLIVVLLLALIALGIAMAILKLLVPLMVVVLIVAGGVYMFNRLQSQPS